MQKVTREMLIEKAQELLSNGTVNRVLGWKKGDFSYDVTPAVFNSVEEMQKDFTFGDFAGANFSKYLVKETKKEGKVLSDFSNLLNLNLKFIEKNRFKIMKILLN